ncbi:hypothetical protein BH23ACT6_BH23ACT6_17180 [soil metagenome]
MSTVLDHTHGAGGEGHDSAGPNTTGHPIEDPSDRDDTQGDGPAGPITLDPFTREDAIAAGYTDRDLRDWGNAGNVRRLSRGVFAKGGGPATREEQLIERGRALARKHGGRVAVSHHAALAMHGIALHAVPFHRLYAVRLRGGVHSKPGLVVCRPKSRPPTVDLDGVRVVQPAVAVAQVAAAFGLRAGVVAADSARNLGLVGLSEMTAEIERVGQIPGINALRRAVSRSRDGAQSPGESLLRLIVEDLGFEASTQFPVTEGAARPFAYADLRLVDTNCLLEFDGAVKYAGVDGRDALMAEKTREDRIRRLGWQLDRVIWRDFNDTAALGRRIRALAGHAGSGEGRAI